MPRPEQDEIDWILVSQREFVWLRQDGDGARCQPWTVETTNVDRDPRGRMLVISKIKITETRGTRDVRLSAELTSDRRLPGFQFAGPEEAIYERGKFVRGGIPLCEAPVTVLRIEGDAMWTDKGPWYFSAVACEKMRGYLQPEQEELARAALTQPVGCGPTSLTSNVKRFASGVEHGGG